MKVLLHMKSGKTLTINNVDNFHAKYDSDQITQIKFDWPNGKQPKKGVLIGSIDLKSIEAVETI